MIPSLSTSERQSNTFLAALSPSDAMLAAGSSTVVQRGCQSAGRDVNEPDALQVLDVGRESTTGHDTIQDCF